MEINDERWKTLKETLIDPSMDSRRKVVANVLFDNLYRKHPDANQKTFLKMVNKVVAQMITPDIVAIQPLDDTFGTIHTLRVSIRRVMPTVICDEIIGCSPMVGPVGNISELRVRYADKPKVDELPGVAPTSVLEGRQGNRLSIKIQKENVNTFKTNMCTGKRCEDLTTDEVAFIILNYSLLK